MEVCSRILPIAKYEALCEKHLKTPQEVNIQALVAAYGVEHHKLEDWEGFEGLVTALPKAGIRIIELCTDSKHDIALYRTMLKEIALNQDIGVVLDPLQ